MAIKIHHLEILDLLSLEGSYRDKSQWVDKINQSDLYSIATWLMINLSAESNGTEHKRSQIREILTFYYERKTFYNDQAPWTDKQKWLIANAVINLWPFRNIANDPRYQL